MVKSSRLTVRWTRAGPRRSALRLAKRLCLDGPPPWSEHRHRMYCARGKPSGLGPPLGAAFLFNNPSDPRFFEQSLEFNSVDTSLSKSFPGCSVSTKAIAHGLVRRKTR